jgi:hypothetical protein
VEIKVFSQDRRFLTGIIKNVSESVQSFPISFIETKITEVEMIDKKYSILRNNDGNVITETMNWIIGGKEQNPPPIGIISSNFIEVKNDFSFPIGSSLIKEQKEINTNEKTIIQSYGLASPLNVKVSNEFDLISYSYSISDNPLITDQSFKQIEIKNNFCINATPSNELIINNEDNFIVKESYLLKSKIGIGLNIPDVREISTDQLIGNTGASGGISEIMLETNKTYLKLGNYDIIETSTLPAGLQLIDNCIKGIPEVRGTYIIQAKTAKGNEIVFKIVINSFDRIL